jgi:tetratricopeptide (TPR) repeat protein
VVFTPDYFKGSDYERARLLYESGYLIESRAMAERVAKNDPSYEAARKLLRDIRRVYLDISRAHMEMGEDYERAGIIPSAIAEYKKSLKYNPDNFLVKRRISMLIEGAPYPVKPADPPKAQKPKPVKKQNFAKPKPDPEELANEHYMKGKVYLESRAFGKAIEEFTSVLDILPAFMDTKELLEKARSERDDSVDFHFKRGINYFQNEEIALAIREWNIVLELDPENKEAEDYKERAMVIMERLQKIQERQADKP